MQSLKVIDVPIRQDGEGRYCVNDMHRAAGGEKKHQPAYWLASKQTKALIAELSTTGIPVVVINGGNERGTYVAKEMVYAYAMWVSAAFHVRVIRSYDAMVTEGFDRISDLQYRSACIELELKQAFGDASRCGFGLRKWQDDRPRLETAAQALRNEMQPGLFLN